MGRFVSSTEVVGEVHLPAGVHDANAELVCLWPKHRIVVSSAGAFGKHAAQHLGDLCVHGPGAQPVGIPWLSASAWHPHTKADSSSGGEGCG